MLRRFLIGLVVLALGSGLGCYTMLRHPSSDLDTGGTPDQTCADCHNATEAHNWADDYYLGYYDFYSTPWQSYYTHPWWHNQSWAFPSSPGGGGDNSGSVTGQRSLWDRGPGAPAASPMGGSSYTPSGGSHSVPASHDSTGAAAPNKQTKKDEQTPRRNAWSR
jgi:hypothetical protein